MYDLVKHAAVLSGFRIYDENEFKNVIEYQLINGQFKFIEHDGHTIGFFGWLTNKTDEGTSICINNMFIIKGRNNHFNIFSLHRLLKQKYPDLYMIEWHSQKKDEFKKLIVKGRKI